MFQLHTSPSLPEEHLQGDAIPPEKKTKGQILQEVVPPEYHEFADVFSEGDTKEIPPIDLTTTQSISRKELPPLSARCTTCRRSS